MQNKANEFVAEYYKLLHVQVFKSSKDPINLAAKKNNESKAHMINRLLHDEIKKVLGEEYIYPEK